MKHILMILAAVTLFACEKAHDDQAGAMKVDTVLCILDNAQMPAETIKAQCVLRDDQVATSVKLVDAYKAKRDTYAAEHCSQATGRGN